MYLTINMRMLSGTHFFSLTNIGAKKQKGKGVIFFMRFLMFIDAVAFTSIFSYHMNKQCDIMSDGKRPGKRSCVLIAQSLQIPFSYI